MFIGPCIIAIVDEWKANLISLAILFHLLCAQHVSDINISIFRSLRLCWWITTSVVLFSVRCVLELLLRLVFGDVRFAGWSTTCWGHNKWNKIASDIKLVFHSSASLLRLWNLKYRNGTAVFSLPLQFRVRVAQSTFRQLPQSSSFVRNSLSLSHRPDTVFALNLMTIPTKVDAQRQRSAHTTLVPILTARFGTEFGV